MTLIPFLLINYLLLRIVENPCYQIFVPLSFYFRAVAVVGGFYQSDWSTIKIRRVNYSTVNVVTSLVGVITSVRIILNSV